MFVRSDCVGSLAKRTRQTNWLLSLCETLASAKSTKHEKIVKIARESPSRALSLCTKGTSSEFGFYMSLDVLQDANPSLGIIHYSTLRRTFVPSAPPPESLSPFVLGTLRPPAAVLVRSHFATLPSQLHLLESGRDC